MLCYVVFTTTMSCCRMPQKRNNESFHLGIIKSLRPADKRNYQSEMTQNKIEWRPPPHPLLILTLPPSISGSLSYFDILQKYLTKDQQVIQTYSRQFQIIQMFCSLLKLSMKAKVLQQMFSH